MHIEAQRMRRLVYVQNWLLGIGTLLVLGSLLMAWCANRAAMGAIKVTREFGKHQSRAYVSIEKAFIEHGYEPKIFLEVINNGLTPPKWVEIECACRKQDFGEPTVWLDTITFSKPTRWDMAAMREPQTVIANAKCDVGNVSTVINSARRDKRLLVLQGILRWETFFGEIFFTEFIYNCRIEADLFISTGDNVGDYEASTEVMTQPTGKRKAYQKEDKK